MEFYEIVHLLHKMNLVRRIVSDRAVAKTGLRRGRLRILRYIHDHEGCTQRSIADTLHISSASVTMTLRRMENDHLLSRYVDPKDLRCNRLLLTDEGRDYLQRSCQVFHALDKQMFNGFSQEELTLLGNMLQRLIANTGGKELENMSFFDMMALEKELQKQQEVTDA